MAATETAMNSQGSAAKENEKILGELEAKTAALKSAFEQLSQTVVDSDLVKYFLDLGTAILNGLNTPLGATLTQITLVGGALIGLTGMLTKGGFFDYFTRFMSLFTIDKYLSSVNFLVEGLTNGLETIITKTKDAKAWTELFFESWTGFAKTINLTMPQFLLLGAAVTGVVVGTIALIDKMNLTYKEAEKNVSDLKRQRDEAFGPGSRYDELINKQSELNELEREELDYLQKKLDLQNDQIAAAEKQAFEEWQKEFGSKKMVVQKDALGNLVSEPVTQDIYQLNHLNDTLLKMNENLQNGSMNIEDFHGAMGELLSKESDYVKQLEEFSEKGFELSQDQQTHIDLFHSLLEAYSEGLPSIEEFGVVMQTAMENAGLSTDEAIERAGALMDALRDVIAEDPEVEIEDNSKEAKEDIESVGTMADKIASKRYNIWFNVGHDPFPNVTGKGFASGTDNASAGPALVNELGPELISANGRAYIAGDGSPTVANLPKGAVVLTADETEQALSGGNLNEIGMAAASGGRIFGKFNKKKPVTPSSNYRPGLPGYLRPSRTPGSTILADRIKNKTKTEHTTTQKKTKSGWADVTTPETGGNGNGSGGGGSAAQEVKEEKKLEDILKEQTKTYQEQIEILEHKFFLMEKEDASDEDKIAHLKKIQAELDKQKEWYYSQGLDANSEYIRNLEEQWWEYEDQIKDIYREQASIYESLFGAVANKAQGEIDALELKKQEIYAQNEELEKQVQLEQALDALARAKQQKTLVFKDGKMQYVQNVDAVSSAQAAVNQIKKQQEIDKQIQDIDKQIQAWEKYRDEWASVVDKYEENQNLLLIEQKLGIKLEGENWEKRLDNLQTYINKYDELMVKAGEVSGRYTVSLSGQPRLIGHSANSTSEKMLSLGGASPASMMSDFSGKIQSMGQSIGITIQNFTPNLPNVTDGESFANYMKNNFWRDTVQFVKA